jgi:hypothetical protein
MSVSISPVFNPYTLPAVTRPTHTKDQQGDHDGEARRGDEHRHHAPVPAPEDPSAPSPASDENPTVGTIINVRA